MTGVIIRPNEPFEKALKRFTKSCEKSGILSDLRKNMYYEKPSERKKRKLNQAKRKAMKERLIESGVIKVKPRPVY
ncbi:MAG: 30S ribosomal protein S21 [Fibrobacterota bacterium]